MQTAIIPSSDTFPLAQLRNANRTAEIVYFFGLEQLPPYICPECRLSHMRPGPCTSCKTVEVVLSKPERHSETNKDGELVWLEPEPDYIQRVWPKLPRATKSQAIIGGLQRAAIYREALSDGIQLVCYRAYKYGWWVATQEGLGDDKAFRDWVKDAVTAEDGSPTEAYQLASTILNLAWLEANDVDGLPGNLEEIFLDRSMYARWRRKASEIKGLIQSLNDLPPPSAEEQTPEEQEDEAGLQTELEADIQQAVDDINNPEKKFDDLDRPVSRYRAPKVIMVLTGYDELGRDTFEGAATPTQLSILRSRLGDKAEWRLEGEEYGITEQHRLVEYRYMISYACPKCGVEYGEPDDSCISCESTNDLVIVEAWARRTWDAEGGWSPFENSDEPHLNSNGEGAPLHDPDLGVTYTRQWEETDG